MHLCIESVYTALTHNSSINMQTKASTVHMVFSPGKNFRYFRQRKSSCVFMTMTYVIVDMVTFSVLAKSYLVEYSCNKACQYIMKFSSLPKISVIILWYNITETNYNLTVPGAQYYHGSAHASTREHYSLMDTHIHIIFIHAVRNHRGVKYFCRATYKQISSSILR